MFPDERVVDVRGVACGGVSTMHVYDKQYDESNDEFKQYDESYEFKQYDK